MYIAKNITTIGKLYIQNVLKKNSGINDVIMNDWKKSLEFFLFHAFMRGRADALSITFKNDTISLISSYLDLPIDKIRRDVSSITTDIQQFKESQNMSLSSNALSEGMFFPTFQNNDFIQLFNEHKANSSKYLVGNDKDIIMVAEVLKMMCNESLLPASYNRNFYAYTVHSLRQGEIKNIYDKLIGIKFIGDKLASFYLRNVVKLERMDFLEEALENYLPIDRWIENICIQLDIFKESDKLQLKKSKMTEYCLKNDVNQIEFNQGAWLVGFASFPILMEILHKQQVSDSLDLKEIEVFDYIVKRN